MALRGIYKGGRIVGVEDTNKNISREPTSQEKVINQPIQKTTTTSTGGGTRQTTQTTTPTQIITSKTPIKEAFKSQENKSVSPYLIQEVVKRQKFKTERGVEEVPITKVYYVSPSENIKRVATEEELEFFRKQRRELQAREELKGEKAVRKIKETVIKKGELERVVIAKERGQATLNVVGERTGLYGSRGREIVSKAKIKVGDRTISIPSIKTSVAKYGIGGKIVSELIPDTPLGIATTIGGVRYFYKIPKVARTSIYATAGTFGGVRIVGASSGDEAIRGAVLTGVSLYGIRREYRLKYPSPSYTFVTSQTRKLPLGKREFVTSSVVTGTDIKYARTLFKTKEFTGRISTRGVTAGEIKSLQRVSITPTGRLQATITKVPTVSLSASRNIAKIGRLRINYQQTGGVVATPKGENIFFRYEGVSFRRKDLSFNIGRAIPKSTPSTTYRTSFIYGFDKYLRGNQQVYRIIPLSQKRGQVLLPRITPSSLEFRPQVTVIDTRFKPITIKQSRLIPTTRTSFEIPFDTIKITSFQRLPSRSLFKTPSALSSRARQKQNQIENVILKPLSITTPKLKTRQRTVEIEKLLTTTITSKIQKTPIIPRRFKTFFVPIPKRFYPFAKANTGKVLVSVKSRRGFKTIATARTPLTALNIGVSRVRRTRETTFKITPLRTPKFKIGTPRGFTQKDLTFKEIKNIGNIRI